ncbi:MAG: fibronectin type III domain-containing protein [Verrucomicrobia bacterium]|nr:fibronectin type III domain-containing protein [Verrucomicrobiota bacterium]
MLSDKKHAVYWGLKRDSGFEGFRGSQEKGLRDSGIKNKAVAKSRFKFQALAICAALMTFVTTGWGQVTLTGTSYTQNFNGIGTALPTGWTVRTGATATALGTSQTLATAATAWTTTTGQFNNAASANSPSASADATATQSGRTDRALAVRQASSFGDSGAAFVFQISNTTGLTSFNLDFKLMQLDPGAAARTTTWNVDYGFGSTPTTFNNATTAPVTLTTALGTWGSTSVTVNFGSALNNQSGPVWIRIAAKSASSGSGSRPLTAIDDFNLTWAAASPSITGAATATAFTTTYGTASTAQSFIISGSNLTANLVATAPTGFEVSADGTTYGSTAIFTQTSGSASGTLRVRLAANAAVNGTYDSKNIVLSSTGATDVNIVTAASGNSVTAKALTIIAGNQSVSYGTAVATVTGAGSYTPTGFVNGDTASVIGGTASYTTTYTTTTAAGSNVATITPVTTSLTATNYSFSAANGNVSVTAVVPSAPTITGITAGNGQLSVAFTAPSSNGGASITNYEYSTNAGSNWTTPSPAVTASPLLITGLVNGTSYNVQIRAVNSAGSGTATTSTSGTPAAPASPTITVTPATFASALSTTYGTASSTQTFAVSGSTLNSDLTVTAPTGLEISLTEGSGYGGSLNLTATSGTVSATTVYARLKATAAAGNYNRASIGVSGGGATAQSVATSSSGNTVAPKSVTITGLSATGKVYDGTTSVTISGTAAYDGLANGESYSVTDSVTWTFPDKNIGTGKVLSRSASYTAPNGNYSLPAQPSLSADITAKELTGSFTANNKVFDNSTTATVATRAVTGKIGSEDVNHTGGTATFADVDVANGKTVTLESATLTGADAGNYTLTSVSTTTANITQGAAAITFGALPAGKKVGDAAFSAGATTGGGDGECEHGEHHLGGAGGDDDHGDGSGHGELYGRHKEPDTERGVGRGWWTVQRGFRRRDRNENSLYLGECHPERDKLEHDRRIDWHVSW